MDADFNSITSRSGREGAPPDYLKRPLGILRVWDCGASRARALATLGIRTVLILAALGLALSLAGVGCGDGDKIHSPVVEREPFPALTSPENVIQNLESCYALRDYAHYSPLVREDFTFLFSVDASACSTGCIPKFWAAGEELGAAHNMFDPDYLPSNPDYKIAKIEIAATVAGTPGNTNLQGAPEGTLEGYVFLNILVRTIGAGELSVRSKPLFYFAPDDPGNPIMWRVWKCVDAAWDDELLPSAGEVHQRLAKSKRKGGTHVGPLAPWFLSDQAGRHPDFSPPPPEQFCSKDALAIEKTTWGELKAIYLREGKR